MLGPAQPNTTIFCSICCNIPAPNSTSQGNSLYKIQEGDWDTIITCYYCQGEMACIPHSMQMVRSQKKRYSQSSDNAAPKSKYFNFQEILKPNRYSSKKMNAIWGMYNRDSVHNFKSMANDGVTAAEIQAVVQGQDIVLGNQDMIQQQQIQQQLSHQDFKQNDFGKKDDMLGELGKAVTSNLYYFI